MEIKKSKTFTTKRYKLYQYTTHEQIHLADTGNYSKGNFTKQKMLNFMT